MKDKFLTIILGIIAINNIKQQVDDAMKAAMRAREKQRLGAIRLIQAAFKQKEVDERIVITDEVALPILGTMVKQRRDSIRQFTDAKRDDLAAIEEFELTVLQEFMPTALSTAEIRQLVGAAVNDVGATTAKDIGLVMGVLKPKLQGRADMAEVNALVKTLLVGGTQA